MDIESLVNEIVEGINPLWSTLTKIRYVYIEVGKRLSRDTDFFFSVDNKLSDMNLSDQEIQDIYDCEYGRDNKVICKSASHILKRVYDRLGIKSYLVQSNNNYQELVRDGKSIARIYHWFLAVEDERHTYFLTLNTDLPNIQMGLKTEHFANRIRYIKKVNGEMIQVYKGEPIKETTLGDELIESLDLEIGYINTAYEYDSSSRKLKEFKKQYNDAGLGMLKAKSNGNELYYELEMYETSFYNDMFKIKNGDRVIDIRETKMKDISDEDMFIWKKELCKRVLSKIEELLGMDLNVIPYIDSKDWNYDVWLLRLCVLCERSILKYLSNGKEYPRELEIDVQNFQFTKWSSKIKKELKVSGHGRDYNDILSLIDKMNTMMNVVDKRDSKTFSKLYPMLAYNFIPSDHIYENNLDEDGYLINRYIANKFEKVFVNTFSCNNIRTEFNNMSYSEQIVIIKKVLEILFPEINYKNSNEMDEYNETYSPVMNRIHMYPVKSRETGDYAIVFNILGNNSNGDYYFFYNPRDNTFKVANALEIYSDYIVISERMKDRFSIENMEYAGKSI